MYCECCCAGTRGGRYYPRSSQQSGYPTPSRTSIPTEISSTPASSTLPIQKQLDQISAAEGEKWLQDEVNKGNFRLKSQSETDQSLTREYSVVDRGTGKEAFGLVVETAKPPKTVGRTLLAMKKWSSKFYIVLSRSE